jgi:hypothetical protein
MVSQRQRTDGLPTILWIAWKAGEVEHEEPLCLAHRAHVFEHYPETAHGLKRRGERCSMCVAHPPRKAQPREPEGPQSRGRAARGSGRRISPTRHDPSHPSGRR